MQDYVGKKFKDFYDYMISEDYEIDSQQDCLGGYWIVKFIRDEDMGIIECLVDDNHIIEKITEE